MMSVLHLQIYNFRCILGKYRILNVKSVGGEGGSFI